MIVKDTIKHIVIKSRLDYFLYYGIATKSRSVGNIIYTPLGNLVKQKLSDYVINGLSKNNMIEVSVPSLLCYKNNIIIPRTCSVMEKASLLFVSDPITDATELMPLLADGIDVLWEKTYVDTTERVQITQLRLHSFSLINFLSNRTISDLLNILVSLFSDIYGSDKILISEKGPYDYHIRFIINGLSCSLAHIHPLPTNSSIAIGGIAVEELVLATLQNNTYSKDIIDLFDKVLITYKAKNDPVFQTIKENEFDFIDSRNCHIDEKIKRLLGVGATNLYLLDNKGIIRKVEK